METQKIKKSVELNSTKEKVWQILTRDHYTRLWYAAFMQGAYAETDWQVGSKALFKDGGGNGLAGKVVAHIPHELLDVEYHGIIENGKEDYESDEAKKVKGGHEIYKLSSNNGHTLLSVELDMSPDFHVPMSKMWDKALLIIKQLAEDNSANENTGLADEIHTAKDNLLKLFLSFRDEDINTQPFAGSWTPAQVMEHLRKADGGVAETIYAPAKNSDRSQDEKVAAIRQVFLDYSTRLQSPDFIIPEEKEYNREELVSAIEDIFEKLSTAIHALKLQEIVTVFELPVIGAMTRYEFIMFALYHTQRHTHQLQKIYNSIYQKSQG